MPLACSDSRPSSQDVGTSQLGGACRRPTARLLQPVPIRLAYPLLRGHNHIRCLPIQLSMQPTLRATEERGDTISTLRPFCFFRKFRRRTHQYRSVTTAFPPHFRTADGRGRESLEVGVAILGSDAACENIHLHPTAMSCVTMHGIGTGLRLPAHQRDKPTSRAPKSERNGCRHHSTLASEGIKAQAGRDEALGSRKQRRRSTCGDPGGGATLAPYLQRPLRDGWSLQCLYFSSVCGLLSAFPACGCTAYHSCDIQPCHSVQHCWPSSLKLNISKVRE